MRKSCTIRKALSILAALMLAVCPALAEEPVLEDRSLELGNSSIRYPMLTGLADGESQQQVNQKMQEDLDVTGYLDRITMLISQDSLHVTAEWEGILQGEIISCVLSAEGALENNRSTHRWTWSNIDLRDGREIQMDELFSDPVAAREALEEYLRYEVAPELSAHLDNNELTPLPEGFRLEPAGLTLLYPISSLSTLGDRAGAVRIGWNEIRDFLDLREGGILDRIGAVNMMTLTEDSREYIRRMAENGQLPGIPVTIGEGLKALTDRYHLLTDPDVYVGGRLFALEGSGFRNVLLMTDFLSEAWDDSVVQGIRMDRGCAWGLCIGETGKNEWRAVLGDPDSETELDPETADSNRMVPGSCDYYNIGAYQLRLYADTDDTLVSIVLTE